MIGRQSLALNSGNYLFLQRLALREVLFNSLPHDTTDRCDRGNSLCVTESGQWNVTWQNIPGKQILSCSMDMNNGCGIFLFWWRFAVGKKKNSFITSLSMSFLQLQLLWDHWNPEHIVCPRLPEQELVVKETVQCRENVSDLKKTKKEETHTLTRKFGLNESCGIGLWVSLNSTLHSFDNSFTRSVIMSFVSFIWWPNVFDRPLLSICFS